MMGDGIATELVSGGSKADEKSKVNEIEKQIDFYRKAAGDFVIEKKTFFDSLDNSGEFDPKSFELFSYKEDTKIAMFRVGEKTYVGRIVDVNDPAKGKQIFEEVTKMRKLRSLREKKGFGEGLVKFVDATQFKGKNEIMLVTEHAGQPLSEIVSEGSKVDRDLMIRTLKTMGRSLVDCHGDGIFHGDLSTYNLLAGWEDDEITLTLIDFGNGVGAGSRVNVTPPYAPPEFVGRHREGYDFAKDDAYSFAFLMYKMISNKWAIKGLASSNEVPSMRDFAKMALDAVKNDDGSNFEYVPLTREDLMSMDADGVAKDNGWGELGSKQLSELNDYFRVALAFDTDQRIDLSDFVEGMIAVLEGGS